jgi:hypothetical protein
LFQINNKHIIADVLEVKTIFDIEDAAYKKANLSVITDYPSEMTTEGLIGLCK